MTIFAQLCRRMLLSFIVHKVINLLLINWFIQELYLHGNEITTLESAPLCLPVCLSVLSLADNGISDIGQLAYLTRLRYNLHESYFVMYIFI